MAARPGWYRVSPGAVLAGHLPDQFAYCAHAGLSGAILVTGTDSGAGGMMTASVIPSGSPATGVFPRFSCGALWRWRSSCGFR